MLERDLGDTEPPVTVAAVYPQAMIDSATNDVRTKVALVIGFVLLAILILVRAAGAIDHRACSARSRGGRIEIGEGRFKGDLPVQGNDEFATFARSFNTMAGELEARIEELDGERRRVQEAVARFGQALESTHDVSALLGIVIESAMEAVGARGGRVVIVDEQTNTLVEHRRLGTAEDAVGGRAAVEDRDRRGRRGARGADRASRAPERAGAGAGRAAADDAGRGRPADGHRSVSRARSARRTAARSRRSPRRARSRSRTPACTA